MKVHLFKRGWRSYSWCKTGEKCFICVSVEEKHNIHMIVNRDTGMKGAFYTVRPISLTNKRRLRDVCHAAFELACIFENNVNLLSSQIHT